MLKEAGLIREVKTLFNSKFNIFIKKDKLK
jgi:hypothetical protein